MILLISTTHMELISEKTKIEDAYECYIYIIQLESSSILFHVTFFLFLPCYVGAFCVKAINRWRDFYEWDLRS